ncbi:MAG: cytochrome P450 [Umezawaea sp.]
MLSSDESTRRDTDVAATADDVARHATRFDHLAPRTAQHIHDTTAAMRRHCPVARTDAHDGYFVLTRHDDITTAAKRHDLFSSHATIGASMLLDADDVVAPLFETDPDEHTVWRRAIAPAFTPTAAARHEHEVRTLTRQVIGDLRPHGRADVVTALAKRIPPAVVAVLLGLQGEQRDELFEHLRALGASTSDNDGARASERLARFLFAHIRAVREHPGEDALSLVAGTEVNGRVATDAEMVKFAFLLVAAGHLTTTDTIANTVLMLATDHDLRRQVVADPSLIPALIEESVRHESAVAATGRTVRAATRLGDVDLEPGDRVLLMWGSANRDEAVIGDGDVFRLDRGRGRQQGWSGQMGWGAGAHRCLGQHVARQVLRVVIEELLAAIPEFALAPGPPPRRTFGVLRGVESVPLVWET